MVRRLRGLSLAVLLGWAASCAHRPPPASRPELRARHRVHRVAAGETVSGIAQRYDVDQRALVELNELSDPDRIFAGQDLLVPGPKLAPAPSESAPPPSRPLPDEPDLRLSRPLTVACERAARAPADQPVAPSGLAWPVDGVIVGRYGQKDGLPYNGIDLAAPVGTPVWAAAPGEVVFAGPQGAYGLILVVRHATEGLVTIYGRNALLCVEPGQSVRRGQVIALVGRTGGARSPYLYFEVRKGTDPVSPTSVLP